MQSNRLTITLKNSAQAVFEFYINPRNTPLWLDFILSETTSEWPIRVGTIYENQNTAGIWSEYSVAALVAHKLFELDAQDGNYHVPYTHRVIDIQTSELEYLEWVDREI